MKLFLILYVNTVLQLCFASSSLVVNGFCVSISAEGFDMVVVESENKYEILNLYKFNGRQILNMGYLYEDVSVKSKIQIKMPKRRINIQNSLKQQKLYSFSQVNKPYINKNGTKLFYLNYFQNSFPIFIQEHLNIYQNYQNDQIFILQYNINNEYMLIVENKNNYRSVFGFNFSYLNQYSLYGKLVVKDIYLIVIGYQNKSTLYYAETLNQNLSTYTIDYQIYHLQGFGQYKQFSNRQLVIVADHLKYPPPNWQGSHYRYGSVKIVIFPKHNADYGQVYLHACYINYYVNNSIYTQIFIEKVQIQIDFSTVKLYASKNNKYIGILFQNSLRSSTFLLYNVNKIAKHSTQKDLLPDLKIIQDGSIISLDINYEGDIITYIREDHKQNRRQLFVHKHELEISEAIYPCYSWELIFKYPDYCQFQTLIFVQFGLATLVAFLFILGCIIIVCCACIRKIKSKTKQPAESSGSMRKQKIQKNQNQPSTNSRNNQFSIMSLQSGRPNQMAGK